MNTDTASGKVDQLKGQVKQTLGESVGNDSLANSGTMDQVKGHAKEAWGTTKDNANAAANDAKLHADESSAETKVKNEQTAHNVRDSITGAAESVKNFVTGHDH